MPHISLGRSYFDKPVLSLSKCSARTAKAISLRTPTQVSQTVTLGELEPQKKRVVEIHNTYASPDYAPFARRISLTLRLGVEVTLRPNFAGAELIEKRGGPFHRRLVENLAFLGAGPHRIALDAG